MPSTARTVMDTLYGYDIWQEFTPCRQLVHHQGFNGTHPSLSRLATSSDEAPIVIDVGVWKGQSTITLAKAMRDAGIDGCVIAVDTFLGSIEHWQPNDAAFNAEMFQRTMGIPNLYQTFLNNVVDQGVQDYIVPMPQTSVQAAMILQKLGIVATIGHIDAAHEYHAVYRDAEEYWKIIQEGGYLIGDDYHPTWPGVIQGADEFSQAVGMELIIEAPKWILQKPTGTRRRDHAQ